jgi:hypothetical protein
MVNKWLVHIKKTMKKMKATGKYIAGKGLGQVIKAAKLTWHKAKKGGSSCGDMKGGADSDSDEEKPAAAATTGAEVEPAAPAADAMGGKRRRKTRRRRASRRR